jgi:hypothetical protein
VHERAVLQLGDHLFHDGVLPMITFGLRQRQRGVGECGEVAPGGEQLALSQAALSPPKEFIPATVASRVSRPRSAPPAATTCRSSSLVRDPHNRACSGGRSGQSVDSGRGGQLSV